MRNTLHNFLRGIGSAFNIAPPVPPSRVGVGLTLYQSDAETLGRDWRTVATDFRKAFDETVAETRQHGQTPEKKP